MVNDEKDDDGKAAPADWQDKGYRAVMLVQDVYRLSGTERASRALQAVVKRYEAERGAELDWTLRLLAELGRDLLVELDAPQDIRDRYSEHVGMLDD